MVSRVSACVLALGLLVTPLFAAQPALVRLERVPGIERNQLLDAGLPVVEETDGGFLALGDENDIIARARSLGVVARVVDREEDGFAWLVVNLREGTETSDLGSCGQVLLSEGRWALVKVAEPDVARCTVDDRFMARSMRQRALGRWRQAPEAPERLEVKPLVQEMVGSLTQSLLVSQWTDIVDVAPERYSNIVTWGGCQDAANLVQDRMLAYGLETELQTYRGDYAPNVIGTLPGLTQPDQIYIAIGHLDSTTTVGSPQAPGADDNASGSAMVLALAQIMSGYRFASTVKFITVTGEEQMLLGSEAYATAAAAQGDNILGVLNADMIAWQGDGLPASGENLDLIYNSASSSLLNTFVQAAADYATGCPVNSLLCGNMQQSDHWHFWGEGYQALCGITDDEGICGSGGNYGYYHTVNDTIANCGNTTFFTAATKAYLATLAHLADPLCAVPDPPVSLDAAPDGDNRVALSWPSAGSGFLYQVFRAPGGCSGPLHYTEVGETSALGLVDTTASGGVTYAYTVRSVDAPCDSELGSCAQTSTTGPCTEPPGFGGVVSVTDDHADTCTLTMDWTPAQPYCGAGVTYNLYRSTSPSFVPDLSNRIATGLGGSTYDDSADLVGGTTYYYVVRAVDSANGVEEANIVRRSAAPSGPYTIGTWTDDAGDSGAAQLVPSAPWSVAASGGHSGVKVYATGNYGDGTCSALVTPVLHLGSAPQLAFWSKYDIESGWDKGEVQLSTDSGSTWTRVAVNYPTLASHTGDACGLPSGQYYFTGTNTTPTYAQYSASLATWSGQDVQLRWEISSDVNTTGAGWWVDDISITDVMVPGSCESGSQPLFADDFETGTSDAWSLVVP